jgi:hypothetical protein
MQIKNRMERVAWSLTPARAGMRWLTLAVGALLFVGLALPMRLPWTVGVPEVWVCDRDAHQVLGLDGDLLVATGVAPRFPVRVAPRAGGFWAVTAEGGSPIGAHALSAWDGAWTTFATKLGPIVDLSTGVDGDALLVEFGLTGLPSRVLRGNVAGVFELALHPGALAVAGQAFASPSSAGPLEALVASVLVADSGGRVTRYGPGGAVLDRVELGGELVDVAAMGSAAHSDGRVYVLAASGGGRLIALNAALGVEWEVALGLQVQELSVSPDGAHVWVADSTEPLARRYGADGGLELQVLLPASDISGVLAVANGGALFTSPGAVLRVDGLGTVLPGQGGMSYATDLCLAIP